MKEGFRERGGCQAPPGVVFASAEYGGGACSDSRALTVPASSRDACRGKLGPWKEVDADADADAKPLLLERVKHARGESEHQQRNLTDIHVD